jgi:hypothetical protein
MPSDDPNFVLRVDFSALLRRAAHDAVDAVHIPHRIHK